MISAQRFVLPCLLVALACGPGKPAQQAASDSAAVALPAPDTWAGPKACDLITADQISKVTGVAYNTGVTTSDYAADSQCRFDRKDGSKASVMVSLHGRGTIDPYRNVPMTSEVENLGGEAVWNEGNGQLAVKDDESVFSISFMPPPGKKAWAIALARLALPKFNY